MAYYHVVDAEEEWKRTWIGRVSNLKGALVGLAADVGGSVAIYIFAHPIVGLAAGTMASLGIVTVWVLQRAMRRRMTTDERLHSLFHAMRDLAAVVAESDSDGVYKNKVEQFNSRIAQAIAAFFGAMLRDDGIGCAIRLSEIQNGVEVYATKARSDKLDQNRQATTVPIPFNQGLARALHGRGKRAETRMNQRCRQFAILDRWRGRFVNNDCFSKFRIGACGQFARGCNQNCAVARSLGRRHDIRSGGESGVDGFGVASVPVLCRRLGR